MRVEPPRAKNNQFLLKVIVTDSLLLEPEMTKVLVVENCPLMGKVGNPEFGPPPLFHDPLKLPLELTVPLNVPPGEGRRFATPLTTPI